MTASDLSTVSAELAELRLAIEYDESLDSLRQPGIHYVPGTGQFLNPKILFVGEAPGPMENVKLKPFVGGAGTVFRRLLRKFGFEDSEYYVTNVMKYMPTKPNSLDFRKPTDEEIALFRGYLGKEIHIIDPLIVCLMGNVPIRAFFKDQTSVGKLRGNWINSTDPGPDVFVTYHPSSVQYDQSKEAVLERDFAELSRRVHK